MPLRGFGRKVETELTDNVVDDREGCGDESEAVVGADADGRVDFLVLGAFIVAVIGVLEGYLSLCAIVSARINKILPVVSISVCVCRLNRELQDPLRNLK